jgi:hypothetical protein
MPIPSKQIGWSQKAKLLWNITKQLETLTQVAGNVGPAPGPTTTTTTSTTVAPGPTPSYIGTFNVDTREINTNWLNFSIASKDNGQYTNITVNWGDNTSDTYTLNPDSYLYMGHNYASADTWTVTFTVNTPSNIYRISLNRNYNESNAQITSYDFNTLDGTIELDVSYCLLHIASVDGLSTLTSFESQYADLESLSLFGGTNIINLIASNNNLSVLDLTPAVSLQYVQVTNNQLVGIDINDSPNITYLDLSNNSLAQVNVDDILLSLVTNNQVNGYLDLRGLANDAPTSTGLAAKATLEARGWIVYVNATSGVSATLMYYLTNNNNVDGAKMAAINNGTNYTMLMLYLVPVTVYYNGTLDANTPMFTNPELTQFNLPNIGGSYGYAIFTDVTINQNNVPGGLMTYKFNPYTGTINFTTGTISAISYKTLYLLYYQQQLTCDSNYWYSVNAYIPPNQTGLEVGGYVFSGYDSYQGYFTNYNARPYIRLNDSLDTNVYLVQNDISGLILEALPCTYIPIWTVTWGYSSQDAINGVNPPIQIKPSGSNTTFTGCSYIRMADGSPFYNFVTSNFWVSDGTYVKYFNNNYSEGYWDLYNAPNIIVINPPPSPYTFDVVNTSWCGAFQPGSGYPHQTIYSNFPTLTVGGQYYFDAQLTNPLYNYSYFTNGLYWFYQYNGHIVQLYNC